jgi:hypothetical protein
MDFVKPESVENKYNLTSTSQQYPGPTHSGRVPNIRTRDVTPTLSLYDQKEARIYKDVRGELVGHQHTPTPLNTTFFSDANIETLQQRISDQVFMMSGNKHRIDRQSDDDLKLIMRSYYLMFGRNNPDNVSGDLADLNARVVGYAAAKIYSELDFYLFYLNDIQEFAPPIAVPMNVKVYGSRSNELKSFF